MEKFLEGADEEVLFDMIRMLRDFEQQVHNSKRYSPYHR